MEARGFSVGVFPKKKISQKPSILCGFEKKNKKNYCNFRRWPITFPQVRSSSQRTKNAEKKMRKTSEKREKERADNAPERGRGKSCWVFHPASKKHPAISAIVFHYRNASGEEKSLTFPRNGKGKVVVAVLVKFVDVLEISAEYEADEAAKMADVVVNFEFSYGRKNYDNQTGKTVPALRLQYKLQGWRIRQIVDSIARTEWNSTQACCQSSIGSPGYNGRFGWMNKSGFWLENIH
jgi:hypothetical protein